MGLLAPIKRLRERRELAAARRAADDELVRSQLPSPRLAWRTRELLADEHRRDLAEAIVDVIHGSETRYLPGASPLNRAAARGESDLLLKIAAVVADCDRPVRPRGLILVERLLFEPTSPLYARERAGRLHAFLRDALAALEDGA